jgi:cell division septum initiation protein DivIVA
MAKKDSKKGKKGKGAPDPTEVVEAVRERGKGLLEEVSAAAQRIRDSFDDVRVLDDIRSLRAEIADLAERVAKLEQASSGAPARAAADTARRATARKPATPKRVVTPPPPKPAGGTGSGTGAGTGAATGAATTRTRSTATAAASSKDSGGTGKRPAAAKRSTAARKPAGS